MTKEGGKNGPYAKDRSGDPRLDLPEGRRAADAGNTDVRGSAAFPVGVCAVMKFGMVGEGRDGIVEPFPGTGAPDPNATAGEQTGMMSQF